MYYSDYLQLNKILNAQEPESTKLGIKADDEMLFVIIHQTYELWFKQVIYEVKLVKNLFEKDKINDSEGEIAQALYKLKRVKTILELLVKQIDVMETMTPLDFLDFRDLLRPASGFQSIQFKILEALLGLPFKGRFGQEYYISQLREEDVKKVKDAEAEISLKTYIGQWLERMPFLNDTYWQGNTDENFWELYKTSYSNSLVNGEEKNLSYLIKYISENEVEGRALSAQAFQSALFITLYRDMPMLQQPWEILNVLIEIDEQLALWRHRHMSMVQRIIGGRVGTGGSTGATYLKAATDTHYIFKDLSVITSFLVPRNKLPELPKELKKDLGYFSQF